MTIEFHLENSSWERRIQRKPLPSFAFFFFLVPIWQHVLYIGQHNSATLQYIDCLFFHRRRCDSSQVHYSFKREERIGQNPKELLYLKF